MKASTLTTSRSRTRDFRSILTPCQEFNVVTSTINPEFARNSGSIINETIKSGTNQIHGSGFEYYRDTFMNLPGYFALPGERTPFHQNLYGGTLGGPIVKNKLFGFLAYQGYRRRTGSHR